MPLAGAIFVAMLELTLVSEGWPLRRFNRFAGGIAALAGGLRAYAQAVGWTYAEPEEWIAYAGLNAIGVGVLLPWRSATAGRSRPRKKAQP
jgi:hypothetical protein